LYDSLGGGETVYESEKFSSWLKAQGKSVRQVDYENVQGSWMQQDLFNCGVFVAYKMFALA
jgi:hypothetical protein